MKTQRFSFFAGFAARERMREAKPVKLKKVAFSHFFDTLNARRNRACQIYLFLNQLRAFSSTYSLLVALLLFSYLSPQVMSMAYLPPSL